MTRRARALGAPSRIAVALLIAALAFAAAMMADNGGGGGINPVFAQTTVDYDDDNDGLIDVQNLAQLDAIRRDLDGNGSVAAGADTTAYNAAFPNRDTSSGGRMGCPSGTCAGYELRAHLDFDTDGDGSTYTGTGANTTGDTGDTYNNSGAGWSPLGGLGSTFKGNGFTISNLYIKRATSEDVGLFTSIGGSGRVESLGVINAFVHGQRYAGAIAGFNNGGTIAASWSSGAVRANRTVGGLVGTNILTSSIIACYSTASAHASAPSQSSGAHVGGLSGSSGEDASIVASYSTGAVSPTSGHNVGGSLGENDAGTVTNVYWDSTTSGVASAASNTGSAHATAALQTPTGYTGIYSAWNVNVDGTSGNDDPWHFGTSSQYPVLKFGGMDPDLQRGDYDRDDDGLIDIRNLAQLNAVRHDVDGNGDPASGGAAAYAKAFLNRDAAATRMGCPAGACSGYELAADLDFDTDGDGSTYTGTGASATSDSGDAYHNSGSGFEPIGSSTSRFATTFKGNGHVISNLFIRRTTTNNVGLFGLISRTARVESVGLTNAYVYGNGRVGALVGRNEGLVAASYSTGYVRGGTDGGGTGGLVGNAFGSGIRVGHVTASYSTADVSSATGGGLGGLVGLMSSGSRVAASYSTGTVTTANVSNVGGFVGGGVFAGGDPATVVASYWDTTTSARADDGDNNPPEGVTTVNLQAPTGYTGIYAAWNVDVDGVAGADDPWDFGGASAYPTLKYGGMDPADQRFGDYDLDGDGLIEISTLAQLDAVRRDLDGNGDVAAGADTTAYAAAFPDRITAAATRMGCPSGSCTGYELAADLDFDTDGDGATYTGTGTAAASDSGDAYHNSGSGWAPIGSADTGGNRFNTTFKGNGYVISNLFIKRATTNAVGLFGAISASARVESVGLEDAHVHGQLYVGGIVGVLRGPVTTSWVSGAVYGNEHGGGLAGHMPDSSSASVTASYSRANVARAAGTGSPMGGLIGSAGASTSVSATYATGTVTTTGSFVGGVIGSANATATVSASYWDTTTSSIADDVGDAPPEGVATAGLQNVLGYTGIYAAWNVNVDGTAGVDDPWHFGGAGAYPTLKFGGMDPADQTFGDYDLDGDGLIEIANLAQLNAVRDDLNGNGDATTNAYAAAFPGRITASGARMGCPSGTCAGYELIADLDFDTDGDGSTYTGSGATAAGDADDAYYNGGAGFDRIGNDGGGSSRFQATFRGNGHIISNLFIKRATTDDMGLFGALAADARVETVGVKDAYVAGQDFTGILVGTNRGTVAASWSSGYVRGRSIVGGLVGYNFKPNATAKSIVIAGYSRADVTAYGTSTSAASASGLVGAAEAAESLGATPLVIASYSTGTASADVGSEQAKVRGLTRTLRVATIDSSYWDATASDTPNDPDGNGKTTAELQTPTDYAGIYANWNVDVDGVTGGDDPWDFGVAGAYPRLKYGGMDPLDQLFGDYDLDEDGLIEITNLAQLDVVRHDLDGDGNVAAGALTAYDAAFPDRADAATFMGCRSGTCAGYELAADLDFDTDGDGDVDSEDAYPNWTPIGDSTNGYASAFDGGSHDIANLTIARTANADDVGLFGRAASTAVISGVGLPDANVTSSGSGASLHIGALVGYLEGTVRSSYATGTVSQTGTGNFAFVGGLTGWMPAGSTVAASWSGADVSSSGVSTGAGGITGRLDGGTIRAAHSLGDISSTGNTAYAGGAAGVLHAGTLDAFYAAGAATSTGTGGVAHPIGSGITGSNATITLAYWDSTTSGVADDVDTASPEGVATAGLQTVLGYTGIYENWNVNVDGVAGNDDPWHFGGKGEYPALKYGGMDTEKSRLGDYDRDGDGLIEITTLARLDAVRRDLNGDGAVAAGADTTAYEAAFTDPDAPPEGRMGCVGTCSGYELAAHLDFDTDGDGATYTGTGATAASDSGDAYHNAGAGWLPIGGDANAAARFSATFKGNGYVISNLFIKRNTTNNVGLFGAVHTGARIESVGVKDAHVIGQQLVGALVGKLYGPVTTSWVSGEVYGNRYVGGFAGQLAGGASGSITASYSRANVSTTGSPNTEMGGLVGEVTANTAITASYSTGTVTTTGGNRGGLAGVATSATITNSYWDSTTTSITGTGPGAAQTTTALQTPAGYVAGGIYANWNVNVDGVTGNDDPWHFGGTTVYPTLKFGGMDPYTQYGGDYDTDNDGLIEIWTLDRLNAVRWDLDGDAVQGETSAADWKKHAAAFPGAIASLGCPDTADPGTDPGPCLGYELARSLDFNDANADGEVDPILAYPNWTPIGSAAAAFSGDFDGNNHKIANLKITADGASSSIGFFGSASGDVLKTGLPNAQISVTGGDADTHVGALIGEKSGGDALGNWSTGAVTQTGGTGGDVGGLIGYSTADSGRIGASWSSATVTTDATNARAGGLGGRIGGEALVAVYTTGAVTATGPNSYAGGVLGEMEPLTEDGFISAYVTGPVTKTGSCGGANPLYGVATGLTSSAVQALYWNTETTGYGDSPGLQQRGYNISALQTPTDASTIYAAWSVDVDGDGAIDTPLWDFGDNTAYPKLEWDGMSVTEQTITTTAIPASTAPPCAW